jgi:hypothetical protein
MPSGIHYSGTPNPSGLVNTEIERVRTKLPALFDYDDTFIREIEKRADVEEVGAKDMRVPLEIRPGGKFGHFEPDHGDMGLGGGPTFEKAIVPVVYLKHGIQWSTKTQWATDSKRKNAVNYFRHILAKGMARFRRHVDTLAVGDGTGVLGTVSARAVNTPAGFDTLTLASDGFRARLVSYGQDISFYDSTLANKRAGGEATIVAHNGAANTIQIATATGPAANVVVGDKLVVSGLTATPPVSLLGVKYHHASTGTWLGLARSTNPEISGNEVASGGTLAISQIRLALNKIGDRTGEMSSTGKGKRLQAWMHPAQLAAFEELSTAVTVLNQSAGGRVKNTDLLPDDTNTTIGGMPVRTHWAWDRTRIDLIDMDAWGRAVMKEPDFYEVEGRKIFELRGASGGVATSQIFYIAAAFNLFVDNPITGAFVTGLPIPSGY